MKNRFVARALPALALTLAVLACGGGDASDDDAPATAAPGQLSAEEVEHGIGPIRDLALGPLDPALATEGETAFVTKCSACHKVEERYVGPRLGTVLGRRSPEYVMNMMLNANEMVERHPLVRELLAQFYTPMPVQVTDPDEARAILEYLRSVQIDTTTTPGDPTGAGGS
jgi:mono/diheme cytochrome c family protein